MIWRTNLRLAACLRALVRVRVKAPPYHLSCLLADGSIEVQLQKAEAVLATPRCMHDAFTQDFCQTFPTPAAMTSEPARQILFAVEMLIATNTYSTERLHSRNARASQRRVQTHSADIATIALPHMSYSGPSWTAEARTRRVERKRPRMPEGEGEEEPPPPPKKKEVVEELGEHSHTITCKGGDSMRRTLVS